MLMKTPKRPKDKASQADNAVEHLRRELATVDVERADAIRTRHDLEDGRVDTVEAGDLDALEALDRDIERAKRRIDIAESRFARLTLDLQAAEAEAEQARRHALRAEAEAAMTEMQRLIQEEYPPAAMALAALLNRAKELRTVAIRANNELPEGAEPVSTIAEPEFNGRWLKDSRDLTVERTYYVNKTTGQRAGPHDCPMLHSERGKWDVVTETVELPRPIYPDVPHQSVVDFTNLPGLKRDAYIYGAPSWGQPRS